MTPPFAAERLDHVVGHVARMARDARAPTNARRSIGALLVSSASQNVLSATCEMSTITPSRFSSRTTSLPNGGEAVVRRLVAGRVGPVGVDAVGQRQIADAETLVVAQDGQASSIMWPPSIPISAANLPALCAARTSAAVVASTISFGCCSASDRT